MLRFALNRIFWFIPTLLAMAAVRFSSCSRRRAAPSTSATSSVRKISSRLEALYGLDKPLSEQFGIYVWNALHLDFGISYHSRPQTVNEIIGRTFPISLHLGAMATFFAVVVGMTLGVLAAVNQNGCDRLSLGHARDPLLQHAQFRDGVPPDPALRRLAAGSRASTSVSVSAAGNGRWTGSCRRSRWRRAAGDAGALHALEHDRGDPLRLRPDGARAKGLTEQGVVIQARAEERADPGRDADRSDFCGGRHRFVLRRAGVQYSGHGQVLRRRACRSRIRPMILAVVLIYGVFLAAMNLLVDLVYGVIDPRIRY